jgi:hypothetical protein
VPPVTNTLINGDAIQLVRRRDIQAVATGVRRNGWFRLMLH